MLTRTSTSKEPPLHEKSMVMAKREESARLLLKRPDWAYPMQRRVRKGKRLRRRRQDPSQRARCLAVHMPMVVRCQENRHSSKTVVRENVKHRFRLLVQRRRGMTG